MRRAVGQRLGLPAASSFEASGVALLGLPAAFAPRCICDPPPGAHHLLPGLRDDAQRAVDAVHYLSAGAVCFARAVNDTPKIAALLLAVGAAHSLPSSTGVLLLVAIAMASGGWVQSRKVAETMSKRITELNPGQGLTANLVTAGLVLGASRLGVPVSTTHVSCGSIFGIGLATGSGNGAVIFQVLTTWVTTVPVGLALGVLFYWLYVGAGM